jgi:hypothetical protein
MSETEQMQAFAVSGTATQPQRFLVADADSLDDAQASGRWISSADPVEVRQ